MVPENIAEQVVRDLRKRAQVLSKLRECILSEMANSDLQVGPELDGDSTIATRQAGLQALIRDRAVWGSTRPGSHGLRTGLLWDEPCALPTLFAAGRRMPHKHSTPPDGVAAEWQDTGRMLCSGRFAGASVAPCQHRGAAHAQAHTGRAATAFGFGHSTPF